MHEQTLRKDPLRGDEIAEFYERGFIRPGLVFDEQQVETMRALVSTISEREGREGRRYDLLDPDLWPDVDEKQADDLGHVEFLFNLWLAEPEIRPYVFEPTLAGWAAQLIGTTAVRLLEDNALVKAPHSGGELHWHQDFPYWPLAQPNAVTAWIALDDTDATNGAMRAAVGSHLTGERLPAVFGTGTPYYHDRRPAAVRPMEDPAAIGLEVETLSLAAGEVSFHSSLTWHGSGPNDSDRVRRAIVVRYVGDGTRWLGSERYEYNYTDDEVGLAVGDPIGGDYFPLIPL